jgi:transcriptional antiterminator RfaH
MLARSDEIALAALKRLQMREGGEIVGGRLLPIGPQLTALSPLAPASELQRRWHVVQVDARRQVARTEEDCEHHDDICDRIAELAFDVFNPQVTKRVRVYTGRHRTVRRPMLPGYLFAGFDARRECWQALIGVHGVLRVLMLEERPVPVPDAVIEHLRGREIELADQRRRRGQPIGLRIGAYVRIIEPLAFSGLFGTVASIDQRLGRIGVEIDIFGRMVQLHGLQPEMVEAV